MGCSETDPVLLLLKYANSVKLRSNPERAGLTGLAIFETVGDHLPAQIVDGIPDHMGKASEVKTRKIVELFLKYTENKNFDGHREILAENCVFTYPYAAEGAPQRIEGRDEIIERALVGGWKTRRHMKVVEFKYDALADPEWAMIQWSNTSTTDDGKPYDQTYVNVIRVVDGKMREFIEYYDPLRELSAGNPRART